MKSALQVAQHLSATPATDLVMQAKFNSLKSVIRDHLDKTEIIYPIGFESCAISTSEFFRMINDQETNKAVYTVSVPISMIRYREGQVRLVRPEFCLQNYQTFGYSVDFTESEIGVAFFNSNDNMFDIVKKQHTIAQIAAIAAEKGEDIEVILRVVNFKRDVPQDLIHQEASKLFYREVKAINGTKDWEKLYHQVQSGEEDAISVMNFYNSIHGFTWQPVNYPFPLVPEARYSCTKVREISKLLRYAQNDDRVRVDDLRQITTTLIQTLDWNREGPTKEISVYLLRGFFNFEKWLHPLLDDAMGGLGIHFSIIDHIEEFFGKMPMKSYLGSTTSDKKPWQHLVKVADRVNDSLIKSGKCETPFFCLQRSKFVKAVHELANPNLGKKTEIVEMETVEKYIKLNVRNYNLN